VTPVLHPDEVPIQYSSESYQQVSSIPITVSFEVEDDKYGLFSPAILYGRSEPIASLNGGTVSRLMVYEGVYNGLVENGDILEVTGSLQKVLSKARGTFYQLMIGTKAGAGKEYIRLR
jgi:predicted nucleotidyltransferase